MVTSAWLGGPRMAPPVAFASRSVKVRVSASVLLPIATSKDLVVSLARKVTSAHRRAACSRRLLLVAVPSTAW